MNNQEQNYIFYLMIHEEVDSSALKELLQRAGFELTEQKGEGLTSFRNCRFELANEAGKAKLHYTLPPNQAFVRTVSLILSTADKKVIVETVFEALTKLKTSLAFGLMDSELKQDYLLKLKDEGKVNDYLIGLTSEQSKALEEMCYVPLDAVVFWGNALSVKKRELFGAL